MIQVNMLEAKTNLSKLVSQLENMETDYVIISRNGVPVARIERFTDNPLGKRDIGMFDGEFDVPDDIDGLNEEIYEDMGL